MTDSPETTKWPPRVWITHNQLRQSEVWYREIKTLHKGIPYISLMEHEALLNEAREIASMQAIAGIPSKLRGEK